MSNSSVEYDHGGSAGNWKRKASKYIKRYFSNIREKVISVLIGVFWIFFVFFVAMKLLELSSGVSAIQMGECQKTTDLGVNFKEICEAKKDYDGVSFLFFEINRKTENKSIFLVDVELTDNQLKLLASLVNIFSLQLMFVAVGLLYVLLKTIFVNFESDKELDEQIKIALKNFVFPQEKQNVEDQVKNTHSAIWVSLVISVTINISLSISNIFKDDYSNIPPPSGGNGSSSSASSQGASSSVWGAGSSVISSEDVSSSAGNASSVATDKENVISRLELVAERLEAANNKNVELLMELNRQNITAIESITKVNADSIKLIASSHKVFGDVIRNFDGIKIQNITNATASSAAVERPKDSTIINQINVPVDQINAVHHQVSNLDNDSANSPPAYLAPDTIRKKVTMLNLADECKKYKGMWSGVKGYFSQGERMYRYSCKQYEKNRMLDQKNQENYASSYLVLDTIGKKVGALNLTGDCEKHKGFWSGLKGVLSQDERMYRYACKEYEGNIKPDNVKKDD